MGGRRITQSTSGKEHREATIEKIRQSGLVKRLLDHVAGKVEMSPTQVAAAKTLLDRYLPVVKSLEVQAEVTKRKPAADPFYKQDPEAWSKSAGDPKPAHSTH